MNKISSPGIQEKIPFFKTLFVIFDDFGLRFVISDSFGLKIVISDDFWVNICHFRRFRVQEPRHLPKKNGENVPPLWQHSSFALALSPLSKTSAWKLVCCSVLASVLHATYFKKPPYPPVSCANARGTTLPPPRYHASAAGAQTPSVLVVSSSSCPFVNGVGWSVPTRCGMRCDGFRSDSPFPSEDAPPS